MPTPDLDRLLVGFPETLTAAEVAMVLRVHERSVQRWAREGRLSSVRVGRSYRFLRTEVLHWMQAASLPAVPLADSFPPESAQKQELPS